MRVAVPIMALASLAAAATIMAGDAEDPAATGRDDLAESVIGIEPANRVGKARRPRTPYPAAEQVRAARGIAAASTAPVAFAVIDRDGGLRGFDPDRPFSSASASKAILLAAALRSEGRLAPATRSSLRAMIVFSDNEAADAIYAQVGDAGMSEAARHAGMRDFAPTPGYWGGAQITAADLARFYFRLDRSLAGPDGAWARRLLASVTPSQRWGIPAVAGPRWRLWFKGGWRPPDERENSGPVTHQGALLEDRAGRRIGLAILSELSPYPDGIAMLRRIAGAMLAKRPPPSPEG